MDIAELQGRPVLLTVLADITERKQAEAELAAERWRLNHLFEHAPAAIWLEDFTVLDHWVAQLRHSGVQCPVPPGTDGKPSRWSRRSNRRWYSRT